MRTAGTLLLLLPALLSSLRGGEARVFERCELARELRDRLRVPPEHLATWVCIAHRESGFNTGIVGEDRTSLGIFQISKLYWCKAGYGGGGCGMLCSSLQDDNIADDFSCASRIMQSSGFRAWAVYGPHCSGGRAALEAQYTADCFGQVAQVQRPLPSHHNPWWYHNTVHTK